MSRPSTAWLGRCRRGLASGGCLRGATMVALERPIRQSCACGPRSRRLGSDAPCGAGLIGETIPWTSNPGPFRRVMDEVTIAALRRQRPNRRPRSQPRRPKSVSGRAQLDPPMSAGRGGVLAASEQAVERLYAGSSGWPARPKSGSRSLVDQGTGGRRPGVLGQGAASRFVAARPAPSTTPQFHAVLAATWAIRRLTFCSVLATPAARRRRRSPSDPDRDRLGRAQGRGSPRRVPPSLSSAAAADRAPLIMKTPAAAEQLRGQPRSMISPGRDQDGPCLQPPSIRSPCLRPRNSAFSPPETASMSQPLPPSPLPDWQAAIETRHREALDPLARRWKRATQSPPRRSPPRSASRA